MLIKYRGSQYVTCNEYGEKNINLSHMIKFACRPSSLSLSPLVE